MSEQLKIIADLPGGHQVGVAVHISDDNGVAISTDELFEGLLLAVITLGKYIASEKLKAEGIYDTTPEELKEMLVERLDYEPEAFLAEDNV